MVWWTKLNFLQAHTFVTVPPSNILCQQHSKKGTDTRVEIKNFTIVREVLRINYLSRNLISPYHFWGISPRNSTLFTRFFLTGRCAWAGHKSHTVRMVRLRRGRRGGEGCTVLYRSVAGLSSGDQEMVYAQHKILFTSCNQMMSANNTRELSKFGSSWLVVEQQDHNVWCTHAAPTTVCGQDRPINIQTGFAAKWSQNHSCPRVCDQSEFNQPNIQHSGLSPPIPLYLKVHSLW